MRTVKFVHWKGKDLWLGYLQDDSDYWTQGETFEELKENLRNSLKDLESG